MMKRNSIILHVVGVGQIYRKGEKRFQLKVTISFLIREERISLVTSDFYSVVTLKVSTVQWNLGYRAPSLLYDSVIVHFSFGENMSMSFEESRRQKVCDMINAHFYPQKIK